jgi:hypothetical protein
MAIGVLLLLLFGFFVDSLQLRVFSVHDNCGYARLGESVPKPRVYSRRSGEFALKRRCFSDIFQYFVLFYDLVLVLERFQ